MPPVEPPSISAPLFRAVSTGTDTQSSLTRDIAQEEAARAAWQRLIDEKLIEWGRDPSPFDEEGIQAPSRDTIMVAIRLATELAQRSVTPPTRLVPDAHGGIALEWPGQDHLRSIHVVPDGTVELRVFRNHRLVLRQPW